VLGAKPAPDYDEQVKRLASLNEHFLERGIVAVNDLLATFVPTPLQMSPRCGESRCHPPP